MDIATQVQNLDEAVCISHSANTVGKGMYPIILPSYSYGQILVQTVFFNLGMATRLGVGKL